MLCRYGDVRIITGDASATLYKNLVNFCSVIPKITELECVQQASNSTGVQELVQLRSQGGGTAGTASLFVLLLFSMGRHCYAGLASR